MSAAPARRGFFRLLARDMVTGIDEARGIPQVALADLPRLPREKMGALVPRILPGAEILPSESEVRARLSPQASPVTLYHRSEPADLLFHAFNGHTSLEEAAHRLSEHYAVSREEAWRRTVALFLHLIRLGACVPVNTSQR